jgi:hypothetical protein
MRRVAPACAVLVTALCAWSAPLRAEYLQPYEIVNQSPLVQIHGLPYAHAARLLLSGVQRITLHSEISSHFVEDEQGAEALMLDGETTRIALVLAGGFGRGWEWGVYLPYVGHDDGFLDDVIEDWHDLFGLPQGGRDAHPRQELNFHYERDGATLLDIQRPRAGLGDIRLALGWQWRADDDSAQALRAELKLPTGSADDLAGSGAADLSLAWAGERRLRLGAYDSRVHGTAGLLLMGEGDVLPEQQKRLVPFGGAGIAIALDSHWAAKAQLDLHAPVYRDSALRSLDDTAALLSFGIGWRGDSYWSADVTVVEDIQVTTGPDVSFHFALRRRY